jgi:hypothetical protein
MATIRAIVALAGVLAFIGEMSPAFAAYPCADLENKKPEMLQEYLQGERSRLDRNCALYAIEHLGNDHYEAAIKTLIGYLDYRAPDPPTYSAPDGPVILKVAWWAPYLAVDALFQIGKAAIPQLVEAIADASTSDQARNNAGDAVLLIYREDMPEGVAVLARASHTRTDPAESIRLVDQARRQADKCSPRWRNDCGNAALK